MGDVVAPERSKPLGRKAYGSIPHLGNSRMGPRDWHIHEGQEAILTAKRRDRHDRIIVTEKLDGSNCCVAKIGDEVVALSRAGYLARTSPYEQHHHFAAWVEQREPMFANLLADGERIAGEWLLQAHGTRYTVAAADHLFVVFDLIRGTTRAPYDDLRSRAERAGLVLARLLSDGPPVSVTDMLGLLGTYGHHAARDPAEGAVWRCERRGAFDFMAKWVHPAKVDGYLLPEISGAAAVWNYPPDRIAA